MAKFGFYCILSVVVLFVLIENVSSALKCYECQSQLGGKCGNMTKVDKKKIGTVKCGSKQKYCGVLQTRGPGNGTSQIKRNCFSNTTCDVGTSQGCNTCSKDKCNSAVNIVPSLTIALVYGLLNVLI